MALLPTVDCLQLINLILVFGWARSTRGLCAFLTLHGALLHAAAQVEHRDLPSVE